MKFCFKIFCDFIIATISLDIVQSSFGDVILNINKEDPCNVYCEHTCLIFGKVEYIQSCCYRGCRFFKLIKSDLNVLNITKNICKTSCDEAYLDVYERFACYKGCEFMETNHINNLISLCSNNIYTDESKDLNLLLMLPDMPEIDILSDPGLRKELLPGWWYYTGFKLPQTFIKTVPKNTKDNDYGNSDYSLEYDKLPNVEHAWQLEWKPSIVFLLIIALIIVGICWSIYDFIKSFSILQLSKDSTRQSI